MKKQLKIKKVFKNNGGKDDNRNENTQPNEIHKSEKGKNE